MIKCNECGTVGDRRVDSRGNARCGACWSLNVTEQAAPVEAVAPVPDVVAPEKPKSKKGKAQ